MVAAADIAMGLQVVVLVALICVLGLLFHNVEEAKQAAKNAAVTRELAQELRQSSDDLTRFIRTYTVTNNASYWTYFNNVLKIRNGEEPLPVEPSRNWWDLYIADGVEPRPRGPPSAIDARFRLAGFTAEELANLDEAHRQSDALIDVEDVASHAMEGKYRLAAPGDFSVPASERSNWNITAPPNQTFAMGLVHGLFYHHWKGEIMRPLDRFAALSAHRVDRQLQDINTLNSILLGILGAAVGILVIVMLLYFFKLRKDQETGNLLNAVLPLHISSQVTAADVNLLREQAHAQARNIRKQAAGVNVRDTETRFPVLFHEHIPVCWISFSDVCSFTRICRVASCGAIISTLNELFALMDAAAGRFRIVKIKTIGDAFMSCKIPSVSKKGDSKTDAKNIARCGFDMLRFLFHSFELCGTVQLPFDDVAADDDPQNPLPRDLEMRAGVNCGSCASGIVGFDKFLYDIFGDAVNTAARCESSGKPSRVHMPKEIFALMDDLKEFIDIDEESVGKQRIVDLKGIGSVETILISGVRAPKGDSASDQGTAVTFAEIHSRNSGSKKSSLSISSGAQKPQQIYVKSGNGNAGQLPPNSI